MLTKLCKSCGEAKDAAQGTWVTKHGIAEGRLCLSCSRELNKERLRAYVPSEGNRARRNIAQNLVRATDAGKIKASDASKKYCKTEAGKAKVTAHNLARYATPEKRRKAIDAALKWARENQTKVNTRNMLRHVAKLKRTAKWANKAEIAKFYELAKRLTKETGIKHAVDHVIPLQGALVSGLHVENNLQVLTQTANSSKHNKFNPT